MTPEERLDAKVANEEIKLTANLLNALAGGTVLGGIITPIVVSKQFDSLWAGISSLVAIGLHASVRLVVYDLKPEE